MMKQSYVSPQIVDAGKFRRITNGLWFGKCRDIFGGRAFVCISIG